MDTKLNKKVLDLIYSSIISEGGDGEAIWLSKHTHLSELKVLIDEYNTGNNTHLMRHNCFTHMVENGVDINLIQKIAGHSNVKTTLIYTHISHNIINKTFNPLKNISLK